jgi:glycine hydroxymethyltransferase
VTSGLRMGTPAVTTRGFRATEIRLLTGWIADILDDIKDEKRAAKIQGQVVELCRRFPVYQ